MILNDSIQNLILKMDVFMTKKGSDLIVRRELIQAINAIVGEDSLDAIYVNDVDNFNIPDVAVVPLYHKDFNLFLMDGDLSNTCPFGYTIEIHKRCFTELTAEELVAVVIHDILQNVQSCTAKTRFIKAYNYAIGKYRVDDILNLFDGISVSEVSFMAFMDICLRPFRVPVMEYDYIGTDEVLKNMGLGDAYESYLDKSQYETNRWVNRDSFNSTPEAKMQTEVTYDYRTMKTIIASCMDKDIRHYYAMVRNGIPLVTMDHIFGNKHTISSLGFISRKRDFKRRYVPTSPDQGIGNLSESVLNPRNEIELRFQVDKIISEMRYMESEAEREVILYKIKQLTIKLTKTKIRLEKEFKYKPQSEDYRHRLEYVQNLLDELDILREKVIKTDIKKKRYGIWVQWPEGYADSGPIDDSGLY